MWSRNISFQLVGNSLKRSHSRLVAYPCRVGGAGRRREGGDHQILLLIYIHILHPFYKGQKDSARIGEACNRLGITFDTIYTSPVLRADETAAIINEHLSKKTQLADRSSPLAD